MPASPFHGMDDGQASKSQTPVIVTKLHIPAPGSQRVKRHRLLQALTQALEGKVTLLSAPAGYGKTTLLSEWAADLPVSVGWVSLDRGDQDRIRFWAHTIAALNRACPAFQAQRVWQIAYTDMAGDALIAALINELHRLSAPVVLIWDDFHYITEPRLLREIAYFLERLPEHVHLAIASRTVPQLGLSRMRARGELTELETDALRLTLPETVELLSSYVSVPLSPDEMAAVFEQTEGWPVGVCLAALSYGKNGRMAWGTGRRKAVDRSIDAFFFDEVFSQLPDALQQFLLQTSILDRMNAELCQAVTGESASFAMLQTLERMNLFIVPLDGGQEWYRYHHLFQQFLHSQLRRSRPEGIGKLHQAAGEWLERQGQLAEAVEHYLAGSCFKQAMVLVEKLAPQLLKGEWTTLHTWLNRIPDDVLLQKPMLVLYQVGALYLSGWIDEATEKYWRLDRHLSQNLDLMPEERQMIQAIMKYFVAFRGYLEKDFDTFVEFSEQYLKLRPQGDLLVGFGWGAEEYHRVWDIYVTNYGLRRAEMVLADMWRLWEGKKNIYFFAHLCLDYGKLHYEWNQLNEAESFVQKALDIALVSRHPHLTVDAAIDLVRIYAAKGWSERAERMLQSVEVLYGNDGYPLLAEKLRWFRVEKDKMEGKLALSTLEGFDSRLRYDDEVPPTMLEQYELLACLLTARGRHAEAAVLTDRLLLIARREQRQRDTIRLLLHKSLLLDRLGEVKESLETLEEALAAAEPNRYIRTFVDEGAPLLRLLKKYAQQRMNRRRGDARRVSLDYVRHLMCWMEQERPESPTADGVHLALTPREKKTLELIAKGLSNREIAIQMKISVPTVKSHINNLYRKLQVKNRKEAVLRARRYRLV